MDLLRCHVEVSGRPGEAATMATEVGFLLILESGVGGYIAATDPLDARHRASFADGHGWVFRCEFSGHKSGSHWRSRPVRTLWLISTVGRPNSDAMPAALKTAGERHRVQYMFATLDNA
jgi:hypothetical protein